MAVNVTLNKYGDDYEYIDVLVSNLKVLGMCRAKLYALSDDDSVAFGNILSAMRLPKDTEEQIAHRKSELQKQYHKSALVPLEVMQVCRRALDCAEKCKPYIYKYVASDGVIGADLLRTVIRNSVENVTANTSLIVDDNLRTRLDKEAESIVKGIWRRCTMSKYDALWAYVSNSGQQTLTMTFEQIAEVAGVAVDHSLLTYKKELVAYGYTVGKISLKQKVIRFDKTTDWTLSGGMSSSGNDSKLHVDDYTEEMLPAIALRLNGLQNKYPFFNWRNVRFDENSLALFFYASIVVWFSPIAARMYMTNDKDGVRLHLLRLCAA